MPIKWTPENDQHLLLKILEISNQSIDYAAIAEAWSIGNEQPTAKAISERISKLKRLAKGDTSAPKSVPTTPRKPKTPKSKTPSKTPKREREATEAAQDDGDDDDVIVKSEIEESPTKKLKSSTTKKNATESDDYLGGGSFRQASNTGSYGFDGTTDYLDPQELSEMW